MPTQGPGQEGSLGVPGCMAQFLRRTAVLGEPMTVAVGSHCFGHNQTVDTRRLARNILLHCRKQRPQHNQRN